MPLVKTSKGLLNEVEDVHHTGFLRSNCTSCTGVVKCTGHARTLLPLRAVGDGAVGDGAVGRGMAPGGWGKSI